MDNSKMARKIALDYFEYYEGAEGSLLDWNSSHLANHLYQEFYDFEEVTGHILSMADPGVIATVIDHAGDEDFNQAFWTMVQDFLDRKMEAGEAAPSE